MFQLCTPRCGIPFKVRKSGREGDIFYHKIKDGSCNVHHTCVSSFHNRVHTCRSSNQSKLTYACIAPLCRFTDLSCGVNDNNHSTIFVVTEDDVPLSKDEAYYMYVIKYCTCGVADTQHSRCTRCSQCIIANYSLFIVF